MSCAVCLQPYDIPIVLDCNHIFCFLCIKEVKMNHMTCPLCRSDITVDLDNIYKDLRSKIQAIVGKNVWLYASKSGDGWWMYNFAMNDEIQEYWQKFQADGNDKIHTLRIGSRVYTINFQDMTQEYNTRKRNIRQLKFTLDEIEKENIKGIGGVFFKKIQEEIGKFI